MKILISNDGYSAFYYIRLGLAKALTSCGHSVILWDINKKPVNDAFDECEPDIFLGQTYNANRSVINAIRERPHLKVVMKAGDYGEFGLKLDTEKYPILLASTEEIKNIIELYEETEKPDYLQIYYHPDYIDMTHGYWKKNGIPVYSQLLAADIFDYTNGQSIPNFESDITFIGGYWPYKAQVFDKYLMPLCKQDKYNIKIFGNSPWPTYRYCGFIDNKYNKNILKSAIICPSLHEPHSQDFGFDINERTFKLLSNKCFVISDYVEGLSKLFNRDEIVCTKSPREFQEKVQWYIEHKEERKPFIERGYKRVMDEHTYFHRIKEMFIRLNMNDEALNVEKTYGQVKKDMNL